MLGLNSRNLLWCRRSYHSKKLASGNDPKHCCISVACICCTWKLNQIMGHSEIIIGMADDFEGAKPKKQQRKWHSFLAKI